jgi:hypothetical protein
MGLPLVAPLMAYMYSLIVSFDGNPSIVLTLILSHKGIYHTFFIRQSGNTVCSGYFSQECTSPALPLCPRALLVICKLSVTMYSVSHRSVVSTVPVLDVRKSNV